MDISNVDMFKKLTYVDPINNLDIIKFIERSYSVILV